MKLISALLICFLSLTSVAGPSSTGNLPTLREYVYSRVSNFLGQENPKGYSLRRMSNREKKAFLRNFRKTSPEMVLVTGRTLEDGNIRSTLWIGNILNMQSNAQITVDAGVYSKSTSGGTGLGYRMRRTVDLSELVYVFERPICDEQFEK